MCRKFSWMVTFAGVLFVMGIAASSLLACSESCLDEYPCNVPADEPDANHDSAAHGDAAASDAAVIVDANASRAGDAEDIPDADGDLDASGDAADD